MSTRTVMSLDDEHRLYDFVKWTVDNPPMCATCETDPDFCAGCKRQNKYEVERKKKFAKVGHLYPTCQTLADEYEAFYRAIKAMKAANKAKKEAEDAYHKANSDYTTVRMRDYAVCNETNTLHEGDFIDEIPNNMLGNDRWGKINIGMPQKFIDAGYFVLYTKYADYSYAVFKRTLPSDTGCPKRFRFVGYGNNSKTASHWIQYDYRRIMEYEKKESDTNGT